MTASGLDVVSDAIFASAAGAVLPEVLALVSLVVLALLPPQPEIKRLRAASGSASWRKRRGLQVLEGLAGESGDGWRERGCTKAP
jgi:hypothetical protein